MWGVALAAVVPLCMGLVVLLRSRQRIPGVLLMAHGASVALLLGPQPVGDATPQSGPAAGTWVLLYFWLVLLAYLTPNGRPESRAWARWIAAGILCTVLFVVLAGMMGVAESGNPQALETGWYQAVELCGVVALAGTALFFTAIVPQVALRLRRSQGRERNQLLWLVLGSLGIPAGLLLVWANHLLLGVIGWVDQLGVALAVTVLPACLAVAILRHRLFDIRIVLSRTLAYAGLLGVVLGVYGAVLFLASQLVGQGPLASLLGVCAAAGVVNPLFQRLRLAAERWVYGYRSTPDAALRELSRRMEGSGAQEVPRRICDGVCHLLRVPRAWLASPGTPSSPGTRQVPLVFRGEALAELVVEVPPSRRFSAADEALLADMAGYAALLLHVEQLNSQLRASRARIVTAREEERRRLRRDLHDGLGPALAALVLKLQSAARRQDPDLLDEARADAGEAVAEIRRLVEGLRPPALDEVGLAKAIEQRGRRLVGDVVLQVRGEQAVGPLPAAVEVAAYRIAVEALTNVGRHAVAGHCLVQLGTDPGGALRLSVSDDGVGCSDTALPGTGWESMDERAAEIGGVCTRRGNPHGGLTIEAVLPVAALPDREVSRDPDSGGR